MAKQAATTKQTGGGGYSFEDKVAARFMAMMLDGRPPLNERTGVIAQINLQNRTDGWLLDDLLLTLNGKDGESRFALSVKSNQQITPKGFPADFVTAIWEQWHHTVSDVFRAERDYLGLVVSQLPSDIRSGWHGLLEKAVNTFHAAGVTRLETRKSANDIERQLFESLACNLSGKSATKEDQVLILKRTRVFDLDFEETPSRDEQEAVSICQVCLSSGSREEANTLWIFLLQTAREFSATGGSLSLETLLRKLRPTFELQAYPEFGADFERLAAFSTMLINAIPDRIANLASIDRKEEVELLITQLNDRRSVALTGPSGTGKSVVSKRVAQSLRGNGTVVWLDAQVLDASTINEVENKIGLRHPLRTLVDHVADHSALLVLDGLDGFSSNAIQNAAHLVSNLRLGDAGSTWKLLVTCQTEEWERVALSLLRKGVPTNLFKSTNIAFPSDDQLKSVLTDLPSLTALARRIELRPLLRNLKLLDIVASNASIVGKVNASSSVGESDMIRWFWDDVVSDETSGLARSRLLLRLSEHEADQLRTTMAITDLDDSEAKTLKGLVDARIFRFRDEQISFEHDLFGDWFRQRKLVSQKAFLKSFMASRIANPRWLRALRLFGLDLLEQNRADVTAWRNAMETLRPSPDTYDLANDVLLESVIFASNPQPLLEAMWDDLMGNGAELLHRLLRRFLHVATLPNPRYFTSSWKSGGNTSSFSATVDRLPYWPYWLPLLDFLSTRVESVAESVPIEAALMANTWLRRGGRNWPHRNVAAAIALRVAEKYVGADSDHYGERDEVSEAIYNAIFAASYDMPDEAIPLILKLCQRTESASNEPIDENLDEGDEELIPLPWSSGSRRLAPPWPDGPRRRVNERFQEVALLPDAMVPLIESRPAIAREVLLALVIEDPKPSDFHHWDMMSHRFGTEHLQALYPPIYFRGPFRHFLSLQPKDGLETIIRLVNFATARWADQFTKGGQPVPKIKVRHGQGERVLLGDLDVFFWFRDRLIDSHSVPSALMALELWLYEKLANNEPIDEWVNVIFDQSTTVALAAVLCSVGKKHPDLFAGSLRPLLGVWQFYWWDLRSTATREDETLVGISLMSWSGYGEEVFNAVRD